MNPRRYTAIAIVVLLCALCRCSINNIAGGNSSDTGNTVTICAKATDISVFTAAPARIDVFSAQYTAFNDSGYARAFLADSGDTIRVTGLEPGDYSVLVRDSSGKSLIAMNIPVQPGPAFTASYDSLYLSGAITGIAASATDSTVLAWTYAYIPGTPFFAYTGSTGAFSINDIPAGTFDLQFFGYTQQQIASELTPESAPQDLANQSATVTVEPGRTTVWQR